MHSLLQLFLTLLLLLLPLDAVDCASTRRVYSSCAPPTGGQGECVQLNECAMLFNMFKTNTSSAVDRLLANSQCGLNNNNKDEASRILVCCAVDQHAVASKGNVLPSIGTCGTAPLSNRILGGSQTLLDEFPWMVLLRYKKPDNEFGFHCGGTLINTRYVLTASHCLVNHKLPKTWLLHSVRLGEWNTSTAPDCQTDIKGKQICAPLHVDIEIEQRILHEQYLPTSIDQMNDIALLRLKQSVVYSDYIKPICLPLADELRNNNFENYAMDVAGWGWDETSKPTEVKLKIVVKVWKLKSCQEQYLSRFQTYLTDSQLCAGGEQATDTCKGDSGGALMVPKQMDGHETFYAAGITSYGASPCGLKDWPGVYTRVGAFVDWIQQKLEP